MKNYIYFILIICSPFIGYSQNGTLDATDGVIIGNNTTSMTDGTIRYDGTDFLGLKNGTWESLTSSSGGSSPWSITGADIFYNSGNVGLGLSNPASLLDIDGDITLRGNSRIDFKSLGSNTSNAGIMFNGSDLFMGATNTGATLFLQADDDIEFRTRVGSGSYITKAIIKEDGDIGIGTELPSSILHVNGNSAGDGITITRSGTSVITTLHSDFGEGTIGTRSNHDFRFITNNSVAGEIKSNGNWAVGSTTAVEKLDVDGAVNIGNTSSSNAGTIRYASGDFEGYDGSSWKSLTDSPVWSQNGNEIYYNIDNVGIGAINPSSKLHVVGSNISGETVDITTTGDLNVDADCLNLTIGSSSNDESQLIEANRGTTTVFKVNGNGATSIGSSTIAAGFLLSVDGKAIMEEVQVELSQDWPDYVFENDYHLMPLKDVENFINKNGHLPNIPCANKIESDGIALGEMQRLMMEKIEELTLHMIRLEKENEDLRTLFKVMQNEK